jgi:hypothetical protein
MPTPFSDRPAPAGLSEVLAIAGESWRLGDPDCPPAERVLHAMAMVLGRHHVLRRRTPPRVEE